MRSPLSQKLLLLLTYTLLVSARGIDIHIDLDSPKAHHYESPFLGPQQVPDHNATLNFDNLPPGAPVDRYGFLVWTPSIRVAQAASLAASKPNAILISQYNADGTLTHPGFCIDNSTATFKTFDLLGFFIAPAYEPRNKRSIEFNVSVMATGTEPGRALSTMVTLRGPVWPQEVVLDDFKAVATVTVEMTSQIAPTGGPFMPMFLMDDVSIYWRRVEGGGEEEEL